MWDVVVVGGGPVGLFLAAELRRGGVSVVVFERRAAGTPAAGGDRALQVRTLQLLALRGLLDPVRQRAAATGGSFVGFTADPGDVAPPDLAELVANWGASRLKGHLAMLPLIDRDGELSDLPNQLAVWQDKLVEVFADRAHEQGADLRYGSEVLAVTDRGDHVGVRLADGSEHSARWLVGCDGGQGVVRHGFAFDSTAPGLVVYLAGASIEPAGLVRPGLHRTAGGLMFINEPPGELVVIEPDPADAVTRGPVSEADFVDALRRVSGTEATVSAFAGAVRVTDHARLALDYRHGRILLAGDAAHLHSPMGGQGLNIGLRDAAGLGWRLAGVIAGDDAATLDDYGRERRPEAQRVLRDTLAQSALLRTDPHSAALRDLVAELVEIPEVKRRLAERMAGLSSAIPARPDSHPLVGTFAPAPALAAITADTIRPVPVRIDGLPALVVRPDGYIESVA
ncbi:FAD-dependent oxidoreductase [Frankia sp. AgKG'84/4]|uniref:FAD-dependent oxidoreductase n=1 Tax=Frankia sp. AgKG'84/4 TaxID=573490 RepID=UPI00200FD687|nr:FAD-dependent oxidoreductase [Frankia sp. AgKG'84/4]MCL9795908.1 FAD-dependent oxidoreductase [Frankia sp. AgKG'84/4]